MRVTILAVAGLAVLGTTACSSGGTSVEVQRKPVATVSITLPSPIVAGHSELATATPRDADGAPLADRPIVWESSTSQVAIVSDAGMVSAVAPGTAVISATSEGVTGQGSLNVEAPAPAPVASVVVALSSSSLTIGQTANATATTRDAGGNVLTGRVVGWSSSNTNVATVNSAGLVTAVASGSANIIATSEGQSGSTPLGVNAPAPAPVASVTVALSSSSLNIGQTTNATATTRDASGNVLTGRVIGWSSSNTNVATVNSSGVVTAVAAGSANIVATSEGQNGSAPLTVNQPAPVPVATVSVALSSSSLNIGQTANATATTRDGNGNVLTGRVIAWSSSNTNVATVNSSGLVTAVAAGSVNITATSEGKTGSAALTVNAPAPVPVASVSVSPTAPQVQVGLTVQLSAVTKDANGNVLTGRSITWSSNNLAVATVSSAGLVNALVVGSATITATSGSASGTSTVTVTAAPAPGVSPEPGAGDVILWQDNFNKATLTDLLAPYDLHGDHLLIANGHSGSAIGFPYTLANSDNLIEKAFPATTNIYFRYWYRLSPGADPTCGGRNESGMKWFMPWRAIDERYTMGVGNLGGGPPGFENTGLEFASHDNTSSQMPNPFMQNINKSKTFKTTADGAWHEYTLHIVTGNGGYEQIWVDGLLVLDDSAYHYDHSSEGISLIQFPGAMVQWYSGCEFQIDVDDLVVWHK